MGRLAQTLLFDIENLASASVINIELLNIGRFAADRGCYSPPDIHQAKRLLNANCGPASFAAIHRSPVANIMRYFPHFPLRDWTTVGDMKNALNRSGLEFCNSGSALPEYGLALLQLRINDRPLHPLFSLGQTHWVGVCRGCFYDVNWAGWLPIPLWNELVVSQLRFGSRQVCGWEIRNSLAIVNRNLVRLAFGNTRTKVAFDEVVVPSEDAVAASVTRAESRGPFDEREVLLSSVHQFFANRCADFP